METAVIDRAFNAIYDQTYRKTAAFLTARCHRLCDVEDLLQETYLTVYRVLSQQGADAWDTPEAYVLSVARSRLVDWYRREGRVPAVVSPEAENDDWLDRLPNPASTPEEIAAARESAGAVRSLVSEKEEGLQQAFYLHHCFGVTFPEIAQLQNRNESSVRSGVHRLTQELRSRLERSTR